ncbi:MAG: efflux RND transporter permease subunit [Planctomycetes bacterium]|nr:efflux RND transporter permease subunit [Planctomycetota bacterium]
MNLETTGILAAIVRFSLRFRGVIIALAALWAAYAIYSLTKTEYDVFPEFTSPQVSIRLEAPGLSSEQVEMLVTRPVENTIGGVAGIESFRSSSLHGLSAITIVFHTGIDIYRARQMVAERLASMTEPLPTGVTPFLSPLTSSTGTVLQLGLTSKTRSLMDLRTIADWTIKPRLLAAPGVAQVQVYGGQVKQLQIQVRPSQLIKYNLSMDDVLRVGAKATAIRGAGFIETPNQRLTLRMQGQSLTPEGLAQTVLVHHEGANVTLGVVAQVVEAEAPPIGAASVNGQPGVVLLITGQYQANTLDITSQLDQAVADLRPMLQKENIVLYSELFRPATYIHTALRNVEQALGIGAILVAIVLFLFLFNWRTAVISIIAIPLSLLGAVTVLRYFGQSLNTMTMGGLAVAIGEVVDDAVIDVENILRRLRENRHRQNPRPVLRVILDASIEVRSAVVFATFAVVLVFVPVLTLSGVAGRLFAPLGIAYIAAVLTSLVVALTVTPALSSLLLGALGSPVPRLRGSEESYPPKGGTPNVEKEPPVVRWLKRGYGRILRHVDRHPWAAIGVVVLLIVIGVIVFFFLHTEFLPSLREGNAIVHVNTIPGTSLEESLRLGDLVSRELLKLPDARYVSQKTGRAEEGSSTRGIGSSEIDISFASAGGTPVGYSPGQVRQMLAQFPGITYQVNSFLTERIGETLSGYGAAVVIDIFSQDFEVLQDLGQEVMHLLQQIPGAADVTMAALPTSPEIEIVVRKGDLLRWGFDPVTVLDAVRSAYQGAVVGQIYQGDQVFNVAVFLDPQDRRSINEIQALPLRSPGGTYLPLQQLADIYEAPGRYTILHNTGRRVQTITCNVQGRSVNSFVAQARRDILSSVVLPAGTYVQFAGAAQAQARATEDLEIHSALAGIGIILLLSIVLRNHRNVLLVLLNLPFALVGGVLILLLSGTLLSLGAMVGFITVFGITLRNSIMLISHYEHLVVVEGMSWGPEAATRGASERLAPILMTALVTGLGLLPLVVGTGTAGREIEGPMAIVILGGLVTSTILNLLVLPALTLRYGRFPGRSGGLGGQEVDAAELDAL